MNVYLQIFLTFSSFTSSYVYVFSYRISAMLHSTHQIRFFFLANMLIYFVVKSKDENIPTKTKCRAKVTTNSKQKDNEVRSKRCEFSCDEIKWREMFCCYCCCFFFIFYAALVVIGYEVKVVIFWLNVSTIFLWIFMRFLYGCKFWQIMNGRSKLSVTFCIYFGI